MSSPPDFTTATATVSSRERTASDQSSAPRVTSANSSPSGAAVDNTSSSPSSLRTSSASGTRKQAYATEIVKALFGGGPVGDVVDDFSCSFQRQSGRLYVSTDGLFFYSNLFGFEKRIRVNYGRVAEISTLRTTSLSVKRNDGEEYIFRSFDDREFVMDIILRFHSNERGANSDDDAPAPASSKPSFEGVTHDKYSHEIVNNDGERKNISPSPVPANEVQSFVSQKNDQKETTNMGMDSKVGMDYSADTNDENKWKKKQQHTKTWESAVVNLKIDCQSVEDFFVLFLSNDAAYSLKLFSNSIGDKNVSISPWQTDGLTEAATEEATTNIAESSLTRLIRLERNAGFSTAKVERQQSYRRFSSHAACLTNTTDIKGIRGVPSNVFLVQDIWFIEGSENGSIILNVKYHVNFHKTTMLKSIIEKRTTEEMKEFYEKYSSFLRRKTQPGTTIREESVPDSAAMAGASKKQLNWFGLLASSLTDLSVIPQNVPILLFFVCLAVIAYRFKLRVRVLEEIVEELERRLSDLERSGVHVQLLANEGP